MLQWILEPLQKLIYGEVPLFIKAIGPQNKSLAAHMVQDAKGKPAYCLPASAVHHLQLKDNFYEHLREICQHSPEELVSQDFINSHFPEELFGNLLF